MENLIVLSIGGTGAILATITSVFINTRKDRIKDDIFKNPEKLSEISWSKFKKVLKTVAKNEDYFLGEDPKYFESNEKIINKVLRNSLVDVCAQHIKKSGSVKDMNERTYDLWGEIKNFKDNEEILKTIGPTENSLRQLFGEILLSLKPHVEEVTRSYIRNSKTNGEIISLLSKQNSILSTPKNIGIESEELKYLDELKKEVQCSMVRETVN